MSGGDEAGKIRGMVEGASSSLIKDAESESVLLDLVLTVATSGGTVFVNLQHDAALGVMAPSVLADFKSEVEVAVLHFLRRCPNVVVFNKGERN